MKGLTDIPFVADASKLVWDEPAIAALGKRSIDDTFLKRLIHFEARYKSIDNLLESLGGNNILEIASGFSFRGLHMALNNPEVTYIDTDLPNLIGTKNELIDQLITEKSLELKGELMVMPMNALDEDSFKNIVAKLPTGPVNIINEGLLMYLNKTEKTQLCQIIRNTLTQRGGYWITADIYIKKDLSIAIKDDQFSQFLQAHNVEENKFDSFEQAEQFFGEQGLRLFKKADSVFKQLSSLKYIPEPMFEGLVTQARKIGSIRETWTLVAM